jgi:transposase
MSQVRSWEVSDALWERVAPLVPEPKRNPRKKYRRKPGAGRKPLPYRRVFEGIVYVLRTGCQWKALPKEPFGSSSAVHRYFQDWAKAGFFLALWKQGLTEYDEWKGILWDGQSLDAAMTKAPLAQESVGPNPTDRGKHGDQATHPGGRPRYPARRRGHRGESP